MSNRSGLNPITPNLSTSDCLISDGTSVRILPNTGTFGTNDKVPKSVELFPAKTDKLSYEPYGIMFRKGDPALASLVANTFQRLAQTRELRWIYEHWFLKRLPTGERLRIPMSEVLAHEFELLGLGD